MNYRRIIAGLFLIVCTAMMGFAAKDDDPVSKIIEQLVKWLSDHPQEKVYLHLDKPYYAVGDDIWFKAYVTKGSKHKLSTISGVLNVELIDDKDAVKQSIKLPVVNGIAWGDFALADSLREGNYRIRAYTNWMRNDGEDYFFDHTIAIVNSVSNDVFTKTAYSRSAQNGQQMVNAVINYADLDGKPYAGRQVNYEIETGQNITGRGKGETDDNGNLNISFTANSGGSEGQGRIVTHIELADKNLVTRPVLIKTGAGKVNVQFFPEGGNLVTGNDSKIAFKAVGADGLGAAIKGIVTDEQDKQVCSFIASHLGMGSFTLRPEKGKTYKARISYADGSESSADLPVARNGGYTLSIDNAPGDNLNIKIEPGPQVVAEAAQTGQLSLVGQSGGGVYYAGKSTEGSKSFTAVIPKSKFPTGIVQFTLFSSTGEPMNERLVFIENHDQLKLDIASDQKTYLPRQKVKIDLNAMDAAGKPAAGSFSVSVTDETKVPINETNESTILSNLLLTSDLRGYIEQPNYYFTSPDEKTAADLDVLMLTQGYHRFEWKQVLSGSYPPAAYAPEKSLEISGHLKTLFGKPVANGTVILFTTTGGTFLVDTVSDKNGRFTFKNLVFRDSVKFVIQARTAKDRKNIQVDVDNVTQEKVGPNKNAPDLQVNIDDGLSAFLQNSKNWYAGQLKNGLVNNSILLKEVEIKAVKPKKNPAENSSNLNGPGNADQVLDVTDIAGSGCAQIADCLQGRLSGVRFRNGAPYLTGGLKYPMEIVIDGLSVDTDVFSNLNPHDIESIEVLKSITYTSMYGGRGSHGVLLVTTRRGAPDYSVERYAPGIITYNPKGYYKARVFYSPQYDHPQTNAQQPDLRSTIYWKPNIVTTKDGKASFEYFNADGKGTYRIVIEGIDDNGHLGREVYRYKVE